MPPSNINEIRHRLTLVFEQQVKSIPDLDIECCAPNQEAIDRKWEEQSNRHNAAIASIAEISADIQALQGSPQAIDEIRDSFNIVQAESAKKCQASKLWHARQAIRIMEPEDVLVKAEDLHKRICGLEYLRGDYCTPREAEVEKVYAQYMAPLNRLWNELNEMRGIYPKDKDTKTSESMEKEDFFHEKLPWKPIPFGYCGLDRTDERIAEHRRIHATRETLRVLINVEKAFNTRAGTALRWRHDKLRECQNRSQRRQWQTGAQNAQMDFVDFLNMMKFNLEKMGCLSVELRPVEAMEAAWKARNNKIKDIDSRIRAAWKRYGTAEDRDAWATEEWQQLTKIQNEVGDIFELLVKDSRRYHDKHIPRVGHEEQDQPLIPASAFSLPPATVRSRFASVASSNTAGNH